ncbi:MAG TPA: phospholipase [Methylibium sp.]|uniref:phospholipase n=1 Tax=Methylibium sp. TaxID=2067992 RepID=UPI002DBB2B78|nr:phospholipase [Methylibium sp.]HEU4460648.1 phospholipase [Methylibium sp.]
MTSTTNALRIHAGPAARAVLAERGLRAEDVRMVVGAAGGPKGLVLGAIDRFLFADWLARTPQPLHLVGASIGAWRMATAALDDPRAAFARLSHEYIHQTYELEPGRAMPTAEVVSRTFDQALHDFFDGRIEKLLAHPRWRLHIVVTRGRHLLAREGRWRTPAGYLGAWLSNAVSRKTLGAWLERVVFSSGSEPLPLDLGDLRHRRVPLDAGNFRPSLLASCSIPFALKAVHDIPGAPPGAYWDGGITDYHLHWNYAPVAPGLVLYPHFQREVVPGWLDKSHRRRHRATPFLDNVVVLAPDPAWIARLPNAKLPDRTDFRRYSSDLPARIAVWSRAVRESERLADELAAAIDAGPGLRVDPL